MAAIGLMASALSDEAAGLATKLERVLVTVRTRAGGGSGTAWSEDGLVVTNHHVVPGDAAEVVLQDGTELEARVVARDADHDLALLKVDARLTAAEPGDARGVRPGSLVFAIGNPWGLRGTLTSGIVLSNHGATPENPAHVRDVVRADLALAPGNSGGPMTDALGRVVGINSMITGGMAVAIPVHTVLEFVASARTSEPGFLGIEFRAVPVPHAIAASYELEDGAALILTGIEPGSPAETAGLLPGDLVLGSRRGRRGVRHASNALQSMRAGRRVAFSVLRGGQLIELEATPVSRN